RFFWNRTLIATSRNSDRFEGHRRSRSNTTRYPAQRRAGAGSRSHAIAFDEVRRHTPRRIATPTNAPRTSCHSQNAQYQNQWDLRPPGYRLQHARDSRNRPASSAPRRAEKVIALDYGMRVQQIALLKREAADETER